MTEPTHSRRTRPFLHWIGALREKLAAAVGMVILALALLALSELLKEIRVGDVTHAIHAIPLQGWGLAVLLTCVSYTCLTFYDYAALRVIGARMGYPIAARAAATSYAISNTLGLSLLTGGSVRLRIYGRAGLSEGDVARIILLAAGTFWSGIFILFGLSLALEPARISVAGFTLPAIAKWGVPALVLVALAGFLAWTAARPRTLRMFGASLPLPRPRMALTQLAAAAIDLTACTGIVFALFPAVDISLFPQFLAAYILALGVAVLTHSPGGLGVFEAIVFLLLPQLDKSALAAALIGYRLTYYILPFLVAVLALALSEGKQLRHRAAPVARAGHSAANSLAPLASSALVFASGALLIVTGALPAVPERVETLLNILPPTLLDLSHLSASLIGTGMLFVAYGLYRRLDVAWYAAMALLGFGALTALLRGIDYWEASALAVVLLLLAWTRPAFYRQSAMTGERPNPGWLLAILGIVAASIFIGSFDYKHVEYKNDLWWQVLPAGDAQRFLRASLGAALLSIVLAVRRLLKPHHVPLQTALPPAVWERALAKATASECHLARTGDKAFLVAEEGDAFHMYRIRGNSFIVMGDPVGAIERWPNLVWRFRELVDRQGGRVAFYECGTDFLPFAIDLGLGIMKLGEEALVPLADFTLQGKPRSGLRQRVKRMEREGLTFRLVEGCELRSLLPELRRMSDAWLEQKKQTEKQFSLGRFDEDYLMGAPVALVEQGEDVLGFANLWLMPGREELSFDLMRHRTGIPNGTMDYLFAMLMQWGSQQGYARFSLGVAPLSGIENRRLAPIWARIAGTMFRHGERLYGYAGLRRYKEKFRPVWRGRYFAAPHGLGMALALIDVSLLVSAPAVKPRSAAIFRNRSSISFCCARSSSC